MRLVQLIDNNLNRTIALVDEPHLVFIKGFDSIYALAKAVLDTNTTLVELVQQHLTIESLNYDQVYSGTAQWRLLPAIDHPIDPRFCMLSGTGLTHKASAENRQKMHDAQTANHLTDSMKIYQWGLESGKPPRGKIGVQPEWFYKGNGRMLKAHHDVLTVPNYGNDGGEEPELAGVYLNDHQGVPFRIGFVTANEFSDHVMEKKNYLYLAPSKIRNCAIGPELVITDSFEDISGKVSLVREGNVFWEKAIKTGEKNMAHSLENLEYHHFKYANHRIPLDLHIHFFGADAFSFGESIALADGDVMEVHWHGMGRALKNTIQFDYTAETMIQVKRI